MQRYRLYLSKISIQTNLLSLKLNFIVLTWLSFGVLGAKPKNGKWMQLGSADVVGTNARYFLFNLRHVETTLCRGQELCFISRLE